MVFLVVMYGCQIWNHKEIWALKDWCFWTVVLENTLECPLDFEEIKPVNPKGNQPGYSLEGLMLKLKLHLGWPPDAKNWFLGKDPDAGKDWRQEKGTTEYKIVGWHHWLDGHEFEQPPEVGDGQGSLDSSVFFQPLLSLLSLFSLSSLQPGLSHKELGTAEQLNQTETNYST